MHMLYVLAPVMQNIAIVDYRPVHCSKDYSNERTLNYKRRLT